MHELVCIQGTNKGRSWHLTDVPLLLGRGDDCDIRLTDSIVSRQHCRLVCQDGLVHFEDLDSRNPALLNGQPASDTVLQTGDELAVGPNLFMLTTVESGPDQEETADKKVTDSVTTQALLVLSSQSEREARPQTVQDLLVLHRLHAQLGRCCTIHELLMELEGHLQERLHPAVFWLARVDGNGDLNSVFKGCSAHEPESETPLISMRKALETRQALLLPASGRKNCGRIQRSLLVAPILFGGSVLSVLAVESNGKVGTYMESDLNFLMLLARILAPCAFAIEVIERYGNPNSAGVATGGRIRLVGKSRAISHVRAMIARTAGSNLPVLILGETGTGKELVARSLHEQSTRADAPLVVVNCAAIPRDLFESQLFGYEKGAFTGADKAFPGLMAQADGGTLFLDEVGDLSLDNQARILRAIESSSFRRIGALSDVDVDVRIIAATNKKITQAVMAGAFREDLYHRLNVFEIQVPPLRSRKADIPELCKFFFQMTKLTASHPIQGIDTEVLDYLSARSWPGNVRELRNCILRAVHVAGGNRITLTDVAGPDATTAAGLEKRRLLTLKEAEKQHISHILDQCHGNVRKAAKVLKVGRSSLYRKLVEHNIGR